jgi:hypothetical protein
VFWKKPQEYRAKIHVTFENRKYMENFRTKAFIQNDEWVGSVTPHWGSLAIDASGFFTADGLSFFTEALSSCRGIVSNRIQTEVARGSQNHFQSGILGCRVKEERKPMAFTELVKNIVKPPQGWTPVEILLGHFFPPAPLKGFHPKNDLPEIAGYQNRINRKGIEAPFVRGKNSTQFVAAARIGRITEGRYVESTPQRGVAPTRVAIYPEVS